MSAPRPNLLARELSDLTDVVIKRVVENYHWLYDLGYERVTRDSERVRTSGINDEVGGIVGSGYHRRLRSAVTDAARLAAQALAAMRGADAVLARAFNAMEEATPEHVPASDGDPQPRLISKAEHEKLISVQRRRHATGAGYGHS